MASFNAVVLVDDGKTAAVRSIPFPQIRPDWVLVKVKAVAINPSDWKHVFSGTVNVGCRVGLDYAGIVEEVGINVTRFQKGDRIAGGVHGCDTTDPENGSFGEYLIAKAAIQMHLPDHWTFEQGATLGVSTVTVGLTFYKSLGLPLPSRDLLTSTSTSGKQQVVLIYGASAASGLYGVQFAKASGLTVLATASAHNFDLIKSLGADAVFDYKSETCIDDIKAFLRESNSEVRHAWDCIGAGAEICASILAKTPPCIYGAISPADSDLVYQINPVVDGPHFILAYDGFGEAYNFRGLQVPAKPEALEYASSFVILAEKLYKDGTIKPIPARVNSTGSGLEGTIKGLVELRDGNVSGAKLVYTI